MLIIRQTDETEYEFTRAGYSLFWAFVGTIWIILICLTVIVCALG